MTPMASATRIGLFFVCLVLASFAYAQSDDYQEAAKLFHAGQYPQALQRVESYLKSKPNDARARFLQGLIFTEQNRSADAIRVFSGLTADYPELPEPYNNLAVLYAQQGQYDKARTELELAIRTHPSYATAHENLGDIYAKMASQAYDRALQLDKSNASAQTKLQLIKDLFTTGKTPPPQAATKPVPTKPVVAAATPAPAPVPAPPAATPSATPAAPPVAAAPAAKSPPASPPPAAVPAPPPSTPTAAVPAKPAPVATDKSTEVIAAVNSWAKAWSDNDVKNYLAHYAPGFKTPGGEARSSWEATRKARIAKPRRITVQIAAPKVKFADASHATITFRQHYRADNTKMDSTKTLVMTKSGEHWLIEQERVGG